VPPESRLSLYELLRIFYYTFIIFYHREFFGKSVAGLQNRTDILE